MRFWYGRLEFSRESWYVGFWECGLRRHCTVGNKSSNSSNVGSSKLAFVV